MTFLHGLRVLNTRPLPQGHALSRQIEEAGGQVIECPTLAIEPTDPGWVSSLPNLEKVNYAIFISANAAQGCFNVLDRKKINWPKNIQNIAIGHATATVLRQYPLHVDFIPEISDSEHLLALPPLQVIKGKTVLLFKGVEGRTLIAETLVQRGAHLISFDVYRRTLPASVNHQWIDSLWRNDSVDIILFTSQQAMQNLLTIIGDEAHSWLYQKPCLVISNRLAVIAASLGMKNVIFSSQERLLTSLDQFKQGLLHGQYR